jgi:hypothetical protein
LSFWQRLFGRKSSRPTTPVRSSSTGVSESSLDAILILFNREFQPRDQFVNSILTRMNARGHPYRDWMTARTILRTLVVPNAQDPATCTATALVQFRLMLGERANLDHVEVADFEGSAGVSGVVVSHWS